MRGTAGALVVLVALTFATAASYAHPLGHTTENHTVQAGPPIRPGSVFQTLVEGPGAPRVVRALPNVSPIGGRQGRRRSLSYFAQLTDFQLVDEESPARVEFADRGPTSAWRPHEAFHPWAIDFSFRQLNEFTGASPHRQARGARAPMDLGLLTGDQSDNQQYNETVWVRQLIEGGAPLTPNSGLKGDYSECPPASRAELIAREMSGEIPDEPTYMGVQDYDDLGFQAPDYWDPDEPFGDQFGTWPMWPGLMDKAQSQTFTPVGLRRGDTPVPTYVANGNHDGLVQGNEDAIRAFEDIATGCFKIAASTSTLPIGTEDPNPNTLFSPGVGFAVRPDEPGRRFVDRVELKRIYSAGIQPDDHGFAFVDPAELQASGFSATYWARDLKPGIRFISIDTVSDGGVVEQSSSGNIDDPQWRWLQGELERARVAGKLIVVFGHHPIRSLISAVPDEAAQPCAGSYDESGGYSSPDEHGHDQNPGCDLDPRPSAPVHGGEDLRTLLSANPNVIAYVAGHTHENKVLACGSDAGCPAGGNWWEINTSAGSADWPQQSRLIEIMDNSDGTLSLFGTVTDPAAPLPVPAHGTPAAGFGDSELASISHAVAFNDPQQGDGTGEGAAQDQNVELLVDDPRTSTLRGSRGDDVIRGTPGDDLIVCGPGDDIVRAGAGDDVIRCGPGNDRVLSGSGKDRVSGGSGRDRLRGGPDGDRLFGRRDPDLILGQRGRDRMSGGGGSDRLAGGRANDRLRGGAGPDRLVGGRANDRVEGGLGRDRVLGGPGGDFLLGGPGRDRLSGGPGRDRRRP
jgi:RTX calcium-binding nonapeptide repeat (4 copies)/Calcineurin-like phosphoesterase